jgi:hypothetical protein
VILKGFKDSRGQGAKGPSEILKNYKEMKSPSGLQKTIDEVKRMRMP